MSTSPAEQLPPVDALWKYDDPVATEAAMLAVIPAARRSGNEEYLAQLLTQIARSQILQRRFDEGHSTLDAVANMLSDRTPVARIRYLLERGRAWNDVNRADDAATAFAEAFDRALTEKLDLLAVDAAHMLGVMPPYAQAVLWNRRAIAVAEASAEPRVRRWVGTLCLNMGVSHQRLEQYEEAARAFEEAERAFEEAGNAARVRLARLCMAKNRRLQGDATGALPLNRQLLAEIQAAGEPAGYAFEEIAECLLAMGQSEQAKPFFASAYAALSADPWFPPNEKDRLHRLGMLAQTASS